MAKKKDKTMIVTTVTDPNQPYLQVLIGIRDKKAETFIEMGAVGNTGVANRMFADQINNKVDGNNLYKWPDDYSLYALGTYNPRTGAIVPTESPVLLSTGENVKVR